MKSAIDDRYVFRMTDDTGMFQHALMGVPDPKEGYTSDDNARALIMAAMLYERSSEKKYEALMIRYLSFLLYAEKDRWFRNFMGFNRKFLEKRGSEDSFGRCLMALSYLVSRPKLPGSVRKCSEKLLFRTVSSCSSLTCLKGKAYALIGLSLWNSDESRPYAQMLRDSIVDTYVQSRREDWRWFENSMTYCSAALPLALFCACGNQRNNCKIAVESLNFFLQVTMQRGCFKPIGCKGWFPRGGSPAEYDEQPVEACCTMLACLKAFDSTGDAKFRGCAKDCFSWYTGRNSHHLSLIDPETGGCRDGLTKNGLNGNEGAESMICWLISAVLAEKEGWFSSDL